MALAYRSGGVAVCGLSSLELQCYTMSSVWASGSSFAGFAAESSTDDGSGVQVCSAARQRGERERGGAKWGGGEGCQAPGRMERKFLASACPPSVVIAGERRARACGGGRVKGGGGHQ
jgi:hypothetical protein